ncbi:hypothetical protein JW756_02545 [Candidatus Woesearchaeota archaeon]|nr:hypothetical protein [Candidatus Woesearchaeota archaeon]
MFMFIFLGLVDTIIGALMIATHLGLLHEWRLATMSAVYLVGKGVIFRGSFLSLMDVFAGIYFILIMLGVRTILVYAFALVLAYKLITSLIMRGLG